MGFITVDDIGNKLYYEDTGAPSVGDSDSAYTTFIILHGTSFHSATFKHLLPLAQSYKLRIVLVNRRHYPQSSPYTKEEIEKIQDGDPAAHEEFTKCRAKEYAAFLEQYIAANEIPKATEDGKSGGIVLMSWSGGNYFGMPILSYAEAIDPKVREAIESYLRSLIIFDPSPWSVGSTRTSREIIAYMSNPEIPAEERARAFNVYVCGYYYHKDAKSHNIDDLEQVMVPTRRPDGIPEMSSEVLDEVTSFDSVVQSEVQIRCADPEVYQAHLRRALSDANGLKYFPKCRVDLVWCEMSTWDCVTASWTVEELVAELDASGTAHRKFKSIMIPKANHFVHWDEPDKAMKYFNEAITAM